MTMIQYVNTTNYATDTEVEVHRPNCQHVAHFRTARLFWDAADAGLADLDTAREQPGKSTTRSSLKPKTWASPSNPPPGR